MVSDTPDQQTETTDTENQQTEPVTDQPDQNELAFDVSQIEVDRDVLRDLRLMAADTVFAASRGDQTLTEIRSRKGGPDRVHRINPYDLHFDDSNPRDFVPEDMRQAVLVMARSIAAQGVTTPLDCFIRGDRIYVNGGETRWRGALHAINFLGVAVEGLPVILSQNLNDLDRAINKYVGNTGNQFKPLEAGMLFQTMLQLGADVREIARRIGRSQGYVQAQLALMELPEWLKGQIGSGMRPEVARDIWSSAGEDTKVAQELFVAATETKEEEGSRRIMARHVEAAGDQIPAVRRHRPPRVDVAQELAGLLKDADRDVLEDAMGARFTNALFKLAKL
jgi:hypothetical protein